MMQNSSDKNKIEKEDRYIDAFGERINQLAWTEDRKSFYEEYLRLLKSYNGVQNRAKEDDNYQFIIGLKNSWTRLEQVKEQYEVAKINEEGGLASLITIPKLLKLQKRNPIINKI